MEKLGALQSAPAVTEDQAKAALTQAEMPETKLLVLHNQAIVGRYLASNVAGHILARSTMMRSESKRVSDALLAIICGKITVSGTDAASVAIEISAGVEAKLDAADAWQRLQKMLGERDVIDLRAANIAAVGHEKETSENFAPQGNTNISFISVHPPTSNSGTPSIPV